jgi:hypothetical protein
MISGDYIQGFTGAIFSGALGGGILRGLDDPQKGHAVHKSKPLRKITYRCASCLFAAGKGLLPDFYMALLVTLEMTSIAAWASA